MKRLSPLNDGFCNLCGEPAAEGLVDAAGLWCEAHGRIRAVAAFETAAFTLLRTYGRHDYNAALAGLDAYSGATDTLHSTALASTTSSGPQPAATQKP